MNGFPPVFIGVLRYGFFVESLNTRANVRDKNAAIEVDKRPTINGSVSQLRRRTGCSFLDLLTTVSTEEYERLREQLRRVEQKREI